MTNDRLSKGIEILENAITKQISVKQASIEEGYFETYFKNIKASFLKSKKNLDEKLIKKFESLLKLYDNNDNEIINNKDVENNDNLKDGDIIDEKVLYDKGEKIITKYFFEIPPSDKDIKQKFKVDDITTKLSHYWVKAKTKGYFVSANIKVLNEDFYSVDELASKIKKLLPNYSPVQIPTINKKTEKAIFILISDDHAGLLNEFTIYDEIDYTENVYSERLLKLVDKARNEGVFEKCYVISAGDQLNSWSNFTTRGGHEVKSLSNKEQFDMYINSRKKFYDKLFNSGLSDDYNIIDIDNSNHSGLGVSYVANKALEFYINGKYPQVKRNSITLPIDFIEYGEHVIGFSHGKDEKFMRSPMPLNLDKKTDLYLFEYFNDKGISPQQKNITFYKGDLHSYNLNIGKFGRYINLPSISNTSDYIQINFGKSKAGALIEILDKNSSDITSKPIWF